VFDCLSFSVCRGLHSSADATYIDTFSLLDLSPATVEPVIPPVLAPVSPPAAENLPMLEPVSPPAAEKLPVLEPVSPPAAEKLPVIESLAPKKEVSKTQGFKVRTKGKITFRKLTESSGLKVTKASKVSIAVQKKSSKVCRVQSGTLRTLKKGACRVTVSVKTGKVTKKKAVLVTVK